MASRARLRAQMKTTCHMTTRLAEASAEVRSGSLADSTTSARPVVAASRTSVAEMSAAASGAEGPVTWLVS
jgi:hypothetical protein